MRAVDNYITDAARGSTGATLHCILPETRYDRPVDSESSGAEHCVGLVLAAARRMHDSVPQGAV